MRVLAALLLGLVLATAAQAQQTGAATVAPANLAAYDTFETRTPTR